MSKNDGFYSSHDDHYLVCDYCGSDMLVKESENDKSVLYVKCEFCSKNLDKFWDFSCDMENIILDIKHAIAKADSTKEEGK